MNDIYIEIKNISFLSLLISFLILAILHAFYYKNTKDLVLSFLGPRYANTYLREDNIFKKRSNDLIFLLMILNFSIFIWSLQHNLNNPTSSIIFIALGVTAYYFIKYLLLKFLGILLKMQQITQIGWFFTTIFDKVFCLISFPFLLCYHFFILNLEELPINMLMVIFMIFVCLKFFWIFVIGIKSFGLSRFYLFLYICILEFLPLLLLGVGFIF